MTIENRTVTIKNVFAGNANTTIPTLPAVGVSYRNESTTAAEIGEGWPYKEIVDSAKFNQAMYEYTTICQQLEKYGFLPWSANTDYPAQGCALGSDGNVYQAKQATGPSTTAKDPVHDTNHTYWDLFYYSSFTANRAIVSNASGKLTASSITDTQLGYLSGATSNIQTQINAKAANNAVVHLTGNETVAGVKTFTNSMITDNIISTGDITLGTSTNTWGKQLQFRDTTGKRIARIQPLAVTTTKNRVGMWVNNADNTTEKGIYIESDGTTSAPTPSAGDNSTKISTTAFVQTALSNTVHKTGDETIGGVKTFTNKISQKTNYDVTDTSTADYGIIRDVFDKNGVEIGIECVDMRNNILEHFIDARRTVDGQFHNSMLAAYLNLSTFESWATAPASDRDGSIVTTVNKYKSANGYFKLGNGLIIQWGRSSQRTITYPIPFSSDTSFSIVVNNQAGTDGYGRPDAVENLTRTSCMVSSLAGYPVRWIAVGY